jgi:glycosyltransferase involved in cell wall biosynthesis
MRVLIFELDHSGHRFQYVRVLAESLLPLVRDVVLVTSREATMSQEYTTHLDGLPSNFHVDIQPHYGHGSSSRIALGKMEILHRSLRKFGPDHVYIPYADGVAQILGITRWLRSAPVPDTMEIEGILMRGRFAYPSEHWYDAPCATGWLTALSLAPFSVLHQLDPIPFMAIKKRGGRLGTKSRLIPEPVEPIPRIEKDEARRRLGIPVDGRYLACFGRLDIRKGAHLLLEACIKAPLLPTDRVLLMGKIDSEVRPLIARMGAWVSDGRLVVIDDYVSDAQLSLGICAADIVCAPYPRHVGSSGIVVRAAAVEKPVLTSNYGWVGAVTSAFRLGETCDVGHVDEFARQIRVSLDQADVFCLTEGGRLFTRFHTVRNFAAHLTARLRDRLGCQHATDLVSWECVMTAADSVPMSLAH